MKDGIMGGPYDSSTVISVIIYWWSFWVKKQTNWNTQKKKKNKEEEKPQGNNIVVSESLNRVSEKNKLFKPCLMPRCTLFAHLQYFCPTFPYALTIGCQGSCWCGVCWTDSNHVWSPAEPPGSLHASVLWLRCDLVLFIHLVEHTY